MVLVGTLEYTEAGSLVHVEKASPFTPHLVNDIFLGENIKIGPPPSGQMIDAGSILMACLCHDFDQFNIAPAGRDSLNIDISQVREVVNELARVGPNGDFVLQPEALASMAARLEQLTSNLSSLLAEAQAPVGDGADEVPALEEDADGEPAAALALSLALPGALRTCVKGVWPGAPLNNMRMLPGGVPPAIVTVVGGIVPAPRAALDPGAGPSVQRSGTCVGGLLDAVRQAVIKLHAYPESHTLSLHQDYPKVVADRIAAGDLLDLEREREQQHAAAEVLGDPEAHTARAAQLRLDSDTAQVRVAEAQAQLDLWTRHLTQSAPTPLELVSGVQLEGDAEPWTRAEGPLVAQVVFLLVPPWVSVVLDGISGAGVKPMLVKVPGRPTPQSRIFSHRRLSFGLKITPTCPSTSARTCRTRALSGSGER